MAYIEHTSRANKMLQMTLDKLNCSEHSGPAQKKMKASRKLDFSDFINKPEEPSFTRALMDSEIVSKEPENKNGDNPEEQIAEIPHMLCYEDEFIYVSQEEQQHVSMNLEERQETIAVIDVNGNETTTHAMIKDSTQGTIEIVRLDEINICNIEESNIIFEFHEENISEKLNVDECKNDDIEAGNNDEIDVSYEPCTSSSSETESDDNVNVVPDDVIEPSISTGIRGKGRSRKIRLERKTKRNKGEEYITESGKLIKARAFRRLSNCRMACALKVNEQVQSELFGSYWKMQSRDRRAAYLSGMITFSKPSTTRKRRINTPEKQKNRLVTFKYHVPINGEHVKVCKKCFLQIFDESSKFVNILNKYKQNSPNSNTTPDKRGRHAPGNKIILSKLIKVQEHLKSLPSYESHYCRKETNKRYLPPHFTLIRIYEKYCETTDSPVSYSIYTKKFHELNYRIKNPRKDTCQKCDLLKMKLKYAENEVTKTEISKLQEDHHTEAGLAYETKKSDKIRAKSDPSLTVLSFDLQQCLPTPSLETSVAFYKRQLWTFNLTVHNMKDDQATCYVWYETIAKRGANEIGSCLFKAIMNLDSNIKHVILYSDCCPGQNKNSPFLAMCLSLMHENHIETLDHKFMVSGHSRMECDSDHAQIDKLKKRYSAPISHPHDWFQLIRLAGKKHPFQVVEMGQPDFLDYATLLKTEIHLKKNNEAGEKFVWHDVKWLRYTKSEPYKVFYKTSLENDDQFGIMDMLRRGKHNPSLRPSTCYSAPLPISIEKKRDILSLLPYIAPTFHEFYRNLPTASVKSDPIIDTDEENTG